MFNKYLSIQIVYIVFIALALNACQFGDSFFVDFSSIENVHPGSFKLMEQKTTNVNDLITDPAQQALWGVDLNASLEADGNVTPGMQRASSVTMNNIAQQLLDFGNAHTAIELAGIYPSVDIHGNSISLSGKIIVPANKPIKRYIIVSHYTIGSNVEAPSQSFSLEGLLVKLGYGLIIPDYLGYGVTADSIHPYLVMDVTAQSVVDMYLAAVPFLKAAGLTPEKDDVYLMGYSQGGAVTMAVQRLIEKYYADKIKIRRVFAGGGPYDVKITYDRFIETNKASYPCAVLLMTQGVIVGNHLDLDMERIVQPNIYAQLDELINTKKYSTGQMNMKLGTSITSELLSPIGMDRTSYEISELYKALTENSIVSYSWIPQAPVFIMHSIDDEIVPYENAIRAKNKWTNANIQYNFGHYGTHIKTCIRFILTVQKLLINDEQEENGNYTF